MNEGLYSIGELAELSEQQPSERFNITIKLICCPQSAIKFLGTMIKLALRLNKKTILGYTTAAFDQETKHVFEEKYPDYNEMIEIYWLWKQLILEAAFHKINHTSMKCPSGYQFGKKWQE